MALKTVTVQITKTYYKSTELDISVPADLDDDQVYRYVMNLEDRTCCLSDALADASLNADMDGIELDIM